MRRIITKYHKSLFQTSSNDFNQKNMAKGHFRKARGCSSGGFECATYRYQKSKRQNREQGGCGISCYVIFIFLYIYIYQIYYDASLPQKGLNSIHFFWPTNSCQEAWRAITAATVTSQLLLKLWPGRSFCYKHGSLSAFFSLTW